MAEEKFAVVLFTDENDAPGLIALKWANETNNMCYYPNVLTNERRDKLIELEAQPTNAWIKCPIKILHMYMVIYIVNVKSYFIVIHVFFHLCM